MRRISLVGARRSGALCAETIVIRNANIMTVTNGNMKGSIVVKDGKIAEVGEKVWSRPARPSSTPAASSNSRNHRLPLTHRGGWRY